MSFEFAFAKVIKPKAIICLRQQHRQLLKPIVFDQHSVCWWSKEHKQQSSYPSPGYKARKRVQSPDSPSSLRMQDVGHAGHQLLRGVDNGSHLLVIFGESGCDIVRIACESTGKVVGAIEGQRCAHA